MVAGKNTMTDTPDHRNIAAHKSLPHRRLSAAHEAFQQLPIGQIRSLADQQSMAKVLDDLVHLRCHFLPFVAGGITCLLSIIYPEGDDWMRNFPRIGQDIEDPASVIMVMKKGPEGGP